MAKQQKAAPVTPVAESARKPIRQANTPDEMRRAIAGKNLVTVLDQSQTLSAAKKALVLDALYARQVTKQFRIAARAEA
jgi:hypothetical protein